MIADTKPLIDFPRVLSYNPSKNYIFTLLFHQIRSLQPGRSLDAGAGELRNLWMFSGKYVGITINFPGILRGLERKPNPRIIQKHGLPDIYMMRLEGDFSFLGTFDLAVSTFALQYIKDSDDVVCRLSERVDIGGSLIIEDEIGNLDRLVAAIASHYEYIDVVYAGLPECDVHLDEKDSATLAQLSQAEMEAPNIPGTHRRFYCLATGKKTAALAAGTRPEIIVDRGVNIVKADIPYMAMEE